MFRILYVHPSKYADKPGYCVMPVGVPAIVNWISRNAEVDVRGINVGLEQSLHPARDLRTILNGADEYDAVLCDLHWYEHCEGVVLVAEEIKRQRDIPVVVGGFTASIFAEQILHSTRAIDFIIRGDAERALEQLLQCIDTRHEQPEWHRIPGLVYRTEKQIIANPGRGPRMDLNQLDFSDITFLDNWHHYLRIGIDGIQWSDAILSAWLCLGKGCCYSCPYCGGGKRAHAYAFERPKLELRSPEVIIKEIERLTQHGVSMFRLNLDIGLLPPSHRRLLLERLANPPITSGIYNEFWGFPR